MNRISCSALVVALVAFALIGVPGTASAADDRSGKTVSPRVAAQLEEAKEAMNEDQYGDAVSTLTDLRGSVSEGSYAYALTSRMIAYVYIGQDKYEQALPYFRDAVEAHQFPKKIQQNAMLTLAQIYGMVGAFDKTVALLEDWFETAKKPPTRAYQLAATAYYQIGDLRSARKYVKLAIAQSDKPEERWYNLLVGVDWELGLYEEAIDTLKKMVVLWPDNPKYWRNLYGLYLQQDKREKALTVGRIAYDKGLINDGEDLLNLARLEMLNGMPFYAGDVISEGIESGAIEPTVDNLRLLVRAWSQARETDRALATLGKAAAKSDDGQLYLKKAQLCYRDAQWQCAVDAADQAAEIGGLDTPGKAWLFKGMALAQLEEYDQAKAAFEQATNYGATSQTANGWIKYINNTLAVTS